MNEQHGHPRQPQAGNRLPGYDAGTRRGESAAFLGLALVSVALVSNAFFSGGRYAENRAEIIATMESGETRLATTVANTNFAATNLSPARNTAFGGAPAASVGSPKS